MMKSQGSDTEKNNLTEEDKRMKLLEKMHKYKSMSSYCLKCKRNTVNINPRVSNTKNGRTVLSSKCAIWGSKKSRFMKEQKAKGILSSLGLKTPLIKIPLLSDILF